MLKALRPRFCLYNYLSIKWKYKTIKNLASAIIYFSKGNLDVCRIAKIQKFSVFAFQSNTFSLVRHLLFNQMSNEHFLPPDTHTYVCVSGGKKCYFFGKFCVHTK